jgi:DNA-binding MarR family transcriptional regulator
MSTAGDNSAVAREVWQLMSELVLDNQRRREVAEATGMSFGRTRAIRRVAKRPMSMSELANLLGMERPNLTTLINDLEAQGLVTRKSDPGDRRTRLVEATPEGMEIARKADKILKTPPAELIGLDREELETIRRGLSRVRDNG